MYIYSEDKTLVIGCVENGIEIMFKNPIPVWSIKED
jgi:hypothetical protein